MRLIPITPNVLINPEFISKVEFRDLNGTKVLVVTVDGEPHICQVSPTDLMQDLMKSGMEGDNKLWQYWLG